MKKGWMRFFALGMAVSLLGACTKEEQAEEELPELDAESALAELRDELNEGGDTEQAAKKRPSGDGSLNPNLAVMTEGEVEILYTNEKPVMLHDMDGFLVSIDKYQVSKVSDVNRLSESIFKEETGGYVVTALMRIENNRKAPVYYSNYASIILEDRQDRVTGNTYYFVPQDEMLRSDHPEEMDLYSPGYKKQGFQSFVLTEEQYAKMENTHPKIVIQGNAREKKDDYSRKYGDAVFEFPYSDASEKEFLTSPVFYQDEIVNQNLGTKTMLFEKKGIGQLLSLGGVDVEFDGVEYTEVDVSPAQMDKFYRFEESDAVYALTAKFRIENNSEETLELGAIYSTLSDANGNRYRREGMLEPDQIRILEPGESGEKFHVFLLTAEELEQIDSPVLTFGPFGGSDKRLFKGRDLAFKVPY
ncbi:DUF5068 domain-containing protein [Sporosarcina sp. ACRSM]|uniref:DUF5068 domain-containing protein n=1 Tax=Sporosarcina sp. ACRSM TaxID=2918216 RepID=UPI001EF6C5DD|nr:DUF5068 domain-containing protein [Sporosarcina sp. ACRSM]